MLFFNVLKRRREQRKAKAEQAAKVASLGTSTGRSSVNDYPSLYDPFNIMSPFSPLNPVAFGRAEPKAVDVVHERMSQATTEYVSRAEPEYNPTPVTAADVDYGSPAADWSVSADDSSSVDAGSPSSD